MNFKLYIFLVLTVFSPILFSACTSVESKNSEEVVFDDGFKTSKDEIVISDSDFQKKTNLTANTQENAEIEKRTLADNSEVETLIDGFGNKTETRYFNGHPRLRLIILRTSVDGKKEVTVYGYGNDTKILPDLGDRALTASADEISNSAKLYVTRSNSDTPGFMRKRKTETIVLQPLPNTQTQKPPLRQVVQPTETVQPELTDNKSENPATKQNQASNN